MRFLLLRTSSWTPGAAASALAAEQVEVREWEAEEAFEPDGRPAVMLLDPAAREEIPVAALERLWQAGVAIVALGGPEERDIPEGVPIGLLSSFVPAGAGQRHLLLALRSAFREAAARGEAVRARAEIAERTVEVTDLAEIGIKLTTEKDYDTLLDQILYQARRITQSDAGSLYLVEPDGEGGRRLRFKLTQNDSIQDIPFVEFTIPLDRTSLAGYAAVDGEPLVFDDVYLLPADLAYAFNRSFDERYGYRTRSMLVIPMHNHEGLVIGVLQLINRKRKVAVRLTRSEDTASEVLPYSPHMVKVVRSLAGQAGIALENSQLYQAIERLFDGFVRAAVTAIEQRDPTTSGHSERVADLTVRLAQVVDRVQDGPFRQIGFNREQIRELRYAGLLHDFGKVGVREQVLVKAEKLYPADLALIRERHGFLLRSAQWEFEKCRAEYLAAHGRDGYDEFLRRLEASHAEELGRLERFMGVVLESNRPTVLPEGNFESLKEFAAMEYEGSDGHRRPWLTQDEVRFLQIRKGSLDETERLEIERHVSHTFDFLRGIPWTANLRGIPDIAYGHHEKLDGSGYPRKVRGADIPVQTRMMTISDIYDALTAKDRPYKRAVSTERALDILHDEVSRGMLDQDLFRLFLDAKVYEA